MWVGYVICYVAILAIYYTDTWNVGLNIMSTPSPIPIDRISVQGIPHAFFIHFLIQRLHIRSNLSLYRARLRAQPDSFERGRSTRAYWIERMESRHSKYGRQYIHRSLHFRLETDFTLCDGTHVDWRSHRSLYPLLETIRDRLVQVCVE